jgi:hypothetical protein
MDLSLLDLPRDEFDHVQGEVLHRGAYQAQLEYRGEEIVV